MTTNSPPTAAPRREGAGPGRVLAIVASVFLLIIGASLMLGGAALAAVFGTDGQINSAKHPVASPTAAVVTDIASIRDTSEVADVLGTPVAYTAADGGNASGLFVGVGPAVEVDQYLAAVEIDQAVDYDLDPYVLTLSRRDGTETNAEPPTQQDFWIASANSPTGVELSWPIQDGDYRMVLMNADGAAGVQSQLGVGLGLDGMFGVALGLLIGGAVLVVLAIALLVLTRPRLVRPAAPGAYRSTGGFAPPTGPPAPLSPPTGTPVPAGGPVPPAEPPARDPLS